MEALFVGLHDINALKKNNIQHQKSDTLCEMEKKSIYCLKVARMQ